MTRVAIKFEQDTNQKEVLAQFPIVDEYSQNLTWRQLAEIIANMPEKQKDRAVVAVDKYSGFPQNEITHCVPILEIKNQRLSDDIIALSDYTEIDPADFVLI